MSAKNLQAPQVPGAPAVEQNSGAQPLESNKEDYVQVPKEQFDSLLARLTAMENAQKQNPVAKRVNTEANLPDQEEINPSRIKSPVLSKQGWVLPADQSHPAAKR